MPVLDYNTDCTGTETHRLTTLYGYPDFVKQASPSQVGGDATTMPADAYADSAQRLWPCHTAPAVWMSSLFFFNKQASVPQAKARIVEARLLNAADHFNIRPQIMELRERITKAAQFGEADLSDDDFALIIEEVGSKSRHYPLRNKAEVEKAAKWFVQYRDEFEWPQRRQIASRIFEKAAAFNAAIPDRQIIEQTAGFGYSASDSVAQLLRQRAEFCTCKYAAYKPELLKLADLISENKLSIRDQVLRDKVASLVDRVDRQIKLTDRYDNGLARPEEVIYQVTAKMAHVFADSHVELTNGSIYEKAAFERIAMDHIEQWLGTEFANAVSTHGIYPDAEKLAAIAPTLPRADAEQFDRMAAAAKVSPIGQNRAGSAALSVADLQQLAR